MLDFSSAKVFNAWTLSYFRHLAKLPRLLESEDVNMRIAAGETIALLFELARDIDAVSCVFLVFFCFFYYSLLLFLCNMLRDGSNF